MSTHFAQATAVMHLLSGPVQLPDVQPRRTVEARVKGRVKGVAPDLTVGGSYSRGPGVEEHEEQPQGEKNSAAAQHPACRSLLG